MNVLLKNGTVSPENPGAVVEVGDRFGRQQIAAKRAEPADEPTVKVELVGEFDEPAVKVENREDSLRAKIAKR
ncbi:hypothetical protein [Chlorobium sp.]|uniref:hypothetical protein n=1 Tax=Chlorobium sp. TaxID=1095 RepID=UPI003C509276